MELLRDSYFRGDIAIPMFVTAFGNIITLEKNEFVGIVKNNLNKREFEFKGL